MEKPIPLLITFALLALVAIVTVIFEKDVEVKILVLGGCGTLAFVACLFLA